MRLYFFYAIFAILLLPFSQKANAAENDVREDIKVSQATVERLHKFIDSFIDPNKTPAEHAEFFADNAEYYNQGVVSKNSIAQDVARYSRRWPLRFYRLVKIDSIIPDPESDRALISYEIDFEVAQPAKTVAGKAHYIAIVTALSGSPKIEKIEEIITHRRKFSTLEE